MSEELELALQKSRTSAVQIAEKIQQTLNGYAKSGGGKTADANILKYGYSALRSICKVVSKQHIDHLDVYCDIVKRILLPYCRPALSPTHWVSYLENLRYLFYTTIQTKRYAEATLLFEAVTAQNGLLQQQTDYKALLYIYSMYLLLQRSHQQSDAAAAALCINAALKALTQLFEQMLQLSVHAPHHEYPELLTEFTQHFCKQYNFFAAMGAERLRMFEAFFALLKGAKTQQLAHANAAQQSQNHLELLNALVQIDVIGQLRQPIALLHLQLCRALPLLQQDNVIGYTFTMLYYYVKFTCAQSGDVSNFNATYTGLCQKFVRFCEKATDDLMREQCYMDYVVVLCLLLVQLHHRGNACFNAFWQRLGGHTACYAAHLQLLLAVMQLAARLTSSPRAPWTCCSNVRHHVILALAQCGLSAYALYINELQSEQPHAEGHSRKDIEDVQKTLSDIMQHGITAIESLTCIPSGDQVPPFSSPHASIDLKTFYAYHTQLVRAATTPQLAKYALHLAEQLAHVRTKFNASDWVTFLHRLAKLATQCADEALVSRLHAYFVAAMLLEPQLNWTQLRGQVGVYHTPTERVPAGQQRRVPQQCLLECWQRSGGVGSSSTLKPTLGVQQMRLLHWLEAQHLFKYQKATASLQQSLLQCSQTPYDRLMIVRQAKLRSSSAHSRLQPLCAEWRARGTQRTRLEHLLLAHACTLLLSEARDAQHKVGDVENTACLEDNMEELLQRDSVQALKVSDELTIVVAVALEALTAFKRFYELFDTTTISMDEAYIDWEAIVEDVITIAQYLHVAGYVEHALRAWLLLYHIAQTLSDHESVWRALTFCCEHVEYFDGEEIELTAHFDLRAAIDAQQPHLVHALQQLTQLPKRQQGYVLLCLCQLAYYHAHCGRYVDAQQLLQFVQLKHDALPERRGKYDLVRSTGDAVYVRILWKKLHHTTTATTAPTHALLQRCLLRMMDETLERFREFVFISTSDSLPYMCLLFDLTQQMAECAANRLYESNVNVLFVSVLRLALQYGAALRVVQLLTMWMLVNLQREYVQKAQVKQRFIESLLGVTHRQQPERRYNALSVKKKTLSVTSATVDEMFSLQVNLGLQTMRKVAPSNVSPIRTQKLEISPTTRRRGLRTFLRTNSSGDGDGSGNCSDWLNWCHFALGCLNARLYYLIEDYEQLDDFYAHAQRWLHARTDNFNCRYFHNFQLLAMQHYINYLRSRGKHELALQQLDELQMRVQRMRGQVDVMYGVNAQLQRRTLHVQLQRKCPPAQERAERAQLRRALTFNASFEERQQLQQQQQRLKTSVYTPHASSSIGKTPKYKTKPIAFKIFSSDDEGGGMTSSTTKELHNRYLNVWNLLDSSGDEESTEKPLPCKVQTQSVGAKRKVIATCAPDAQTQCASTAAKTVRRTPARTRVATTNTATTTTTKTAVTATTSTKSGGGVETAQQQLNTMFNSLTLSKTKSPYLLTTADIDRALNSMDIVETPFAAAAAATPTPVAAAVAPAVSNTATKRGRPKKVTLVKQARTVENADAENDALQTPAQPPSEKPKSRQRKITNTMLSSVLKEFGTPYETPAIGSTKRENDENAELNAALQTPVASTAPLPIERPKSRQRKIPNTMLSQALKEFATPNATAASVKTRRRAIGGTKRENDENAEVLVIGLNALGSSGTSTSTSSGSGSIATTRRRRERT